MSKHDTDMENDAALWARIAKTAKPLKKRNRVIGLRASRSALPPLLGCVILAARLTQEGRP